jgi:CheY-like chemotaxis protein
LTLEEVKTEVFGKHWQDESWHEVLRLITGMIDTSFAGEIIGYLMAQNGEAQNFINLFLAGNCFSEVRNRSLLGATATQLLNQLKDLTKYDFNYDYKLYEVGGRASIVRDIRTKAVAAVSTILPEAPETLSWLKLLALSHRDWYVRQAAVQELIVGWHNHPETLPWLKKCNFQEKKYSAIDQGMELLIREIASEFNPRILVVEDEPAIRENLGELLSIVLGSQIEIALATDGLEALEALEHKPYDVILMGMMMPRLNGWETTHRIIQKWSSQISSKEHQKENRPWIIAVTAQAHERCADVGIDDYLQKPFLIPALFGALFDAITKNFRDDPEALALLKSRVQSDENWEVRRAAVRAITRYFPDEPETLPLLKSCVQVDENAEVLRAAVRAITLYFSHDSEVLPILKTRVTSDHYWVVRYVVVEELAQNWKDDPDTLPILKTRALLDDNSKVRSVAVRELARGWKNEPDTLPILKQRAQSDDDGDVRRAAVHELARGWKDEPWMFDFLCNCALNDLFERKEDREDNPRQLALEIIIKQYRDHPQTLPLLRDRAENDPDEKVREFAQKKLEQLERQN